MQLKGRAHGTARARQGLLAAVIRTFGKSVTSLRLYPPRGPALNRPRRHQVRSSSFEVFLSMRYTLSCFYETLECAFGQWLCPCCVLSEMEELEQNIKTLRDDSLELRDKLKGLGEGAPDHMRETYMLLLKNLAALCEEKNILLLRQGRKTGSIDIAFCIA